MGVMFPASQPVHLDFTKAQDIIGFIRAGNWTPDVPGIIYGRIYSIGDGWVTVRINGKDIGFGRKNELQHTFGPYPVTPDDTIDSSTASWLNGWVRFVPYK